MKRREKKILKTMSLFLCSLCLILSNSITLGATVLSLTNNAEQSTGLQSYEDMLQSEEKLLVETAEELSIENGKHVERKSNTKTISKDEFIQFPQIKVDTPRKNTQYGDIFTHSITGLDMTTPAYDETPTNSQILFFADNQNLLYTNIEFISVEIPSMDLYNEAGEHLRNRYNVVVLIVDLDTNKNTFLRHYETNLDPGTGITVNKKYMDSMAMADGIANYSVRSLYISFGSTTVKDWSIPEVIEQSPGQFHKSIFNEEIKVTWQYNDNAAPVTNPYDSIKYHHLFATVKGGTGSEEYFHGYAYGWVYLLTSDIEVIADVSKIKLGEPFRVNFSIVNNSRVPNFFYIYLPKQAGLSIESLMGENFNWTISEEGYLGKFVDTDGSKKLLVPNESLLASVELKLTDTFSADELMLGLRWGSAYADIENFNLIDTASIPVTQEYFTVDFSVDGGTDIASLSKIKKNETISMPDGPLKTGYKFVGWYKDVELENPWDFDIDVVTSDITLYAAWEREASTTSVRILYNTNGVNSGMVIDEQVYTNGDKVVVKSGVELIKWGYTFVGWNLKEDGTGRSFQPGEEVEIKLNTRAASSVLTIHVFAQWTKNTEQLIDDNMILPIAGENIITRLTGGSLFLVIGIITLLFLKKDSKKTNRKESD